MLAWACMLAILSSSMGTLCFYLGRFGFSLVALGWRSFRLLVSLFQRGIPQALGPLDGLFAVELSRLAVGAGMSKVLSYCFIAVFRVETLNVLPRIACLAIDRVSIIVREIANTLYRVRLFFYRLDLVDHVVLVDGCERRGDGLTRNHGMR
jgi:hypothetical protein